MAGNWNWERPNHEPAFNIPPVVLIFTAICVILYIFVSFYPLLFSTTIAQYFIFIPSYSLSDETPFAYLSVLGYSFMHGSWMHLLSNMVWFVVFGTPLANRIGTSRFIALWIVSAIVSIIPYYLIHMHDDVSVVGASGVISALMGAAGRYGFERVRNVRGGHSEFLGPVMSVENALRSQRVVFLIGFWILTDVSIGVMGGGSIAWQAHITGLVFGFLAIPLFDPRPSSRY